ncbi:hypothetical protein HOLleu_12153 [Holothuria leucospilota]|uniref:Uncharacterized protein n=1 Tax=Holothuria leucospilota TaxID=206669 RepID=A0A9Q1HCS5_HOLLE|nr:hypothetical protein HOLleu_12153 [Holothuria leucospilota]
MTSRLSGLWAGKDGIWYTKGVRAALGERFRHGLVKIVQVETKGEKTDDKILYIIMWTNISLTKYPSSVCLQITTSHLDDFRLNVSFSRSDENLLF